MSEFMSDQTAESMTGRMPNRACQSVCHSMSEYIYISDKMPGGMLEYMPDGLSYVRCQMPGDLPCETLETVTWDDDPR